MKPFGAALFSLTVLASPAMAGDSASAPSTAVTPKMAARLAFQQGYPAAQVESEGDVVGQIHGAAFGGGADADAAAEQFRLNYAGMFGVQAVDLNPLSNLEDGRHSTQLMYDAATGSYKFTLIYYTQFRNGVPVFRSDMRLLVRNEPGFPLVLAMSSLKDIGDFSANLRAAMVTNAQLQQAARQASPNLVKFSEPRQVIWAGYDDAKSAPTLALEFTGESADMTSPNGYENWLFLADAATGAILYQENQVITDTITGNVSGMATDWLPPGAAICRDEHVQGMSGGQVSLSGGASPVLSDANGNYSITVPGSGATTLESRLQDNRFVVHDQSAAGAVPLLSQSVTPPGPGNFLHNAADTDEFVIANVNAYLQAHTVRNFVLTYNPTFPTISTQTNMTVNTNINTTCNAFFSGTTINFYRSGGGCSNSAFGDVIHHEYGHNVVQSGGSGQGAYGEGMGDCMGVLISDQPILGYGFQLNCIAGIRTASNGFTYPCSNSDPHVCGQLISGCVWDTRNLLQATFPATYRDIIAALTVNSVPMHAGSGIAPSIYSTFLTLDDDDANVNNGTPHCYEINKGFGIHSMTQGTLTATSFQFPGGRPATVVANTPATISVNVVPGTCPAVFDGTGTVYYRVGTSGPFISAPMSHIGPNQYVATLPAADCLSTIQYYFSVGRQPSGVIYDPPVPSNGAYSTFVVNGYNMLVSYDFQTNPGWTAASSSVDGQWDPNPGVPVNCNRGDPPADYDGSGQCFLTDNSTNPPAGDCNSDVDGGSTTLTSQSIDVTGLTDPKVSYARWYSNTFGSNPQTQVFTVEVSSDGGSNWVNLETVGPTTSSANPEVNGGWFAKTYRIADFVPVTTQFRIRFTAADNIGAVVEAGIDAFKIFDYLCPPPCPAANGDINSDTMVDGDDVQRFVDAVLGASTPAEVCAGDFNGNHALDVGDVDGFANALLAP